MIIVWGGLCYARFHLAPPQSVAIVPKKPLQRLRKLRYRCSAKTPYAAREPWNKDRFIKWANRIGIDTTTVITELFTQYSHEQQAYNGAKSILLLADSYSPQRLEKACSIALKHLSRVRFRDIKGILKNNHDLEDEDLQQTPDHQTSEVPSPYLRGPGYYGGKKNG